MWLFLKQFHSYLKNQVGHLWIIHSGNHKEKKETNFLIKGKVEAWFESKPGFIEKKTLLEGAIWSIPPLTKHRIITLEDVILLESSSPEVDDVIRIEDDTLRGDGRINSEHI